MKLPKKISELQKDLLDKKYTATQMVDSYLANINSKKDLNAFITVTDEIAYKEAKKVDENIKLLGEKAFIEKPLLGAVVAHKDIFLTKDVRTTAASNVLKDYVPAYSATAVKRLKDAGAIMIGKVNCDAWAHGSSGENSDFGPTRNPYNRDFVPGGSSSGSAVSVAADMSLLSTATDTCGSVRLPANYCGIVGLKPTYGAISRYGVIAMASLLDCVAPMANDVDGVRRIFNIMKGEDGNDGTVTNPKPTKVKSKLKIGIAKEFFSDGINSEVRIEIESAIEKFKKKGIEFVDISLPHTKYAISTYYIIQPAEVSSNLGRFDGVRFGAGRDKFGAEAKRRIMLGNYVLSSGYYDAYYAKAMKVRAIIMDEVSKVFDPSADGVDAIIAPVAPTPPFKIGEKVTDPLKMYLTDIFAATANLTGIPSIAIPSGTTRSGLPLGFQLMGPRFGEDILFKLGGLYERI